METNWIIRHALSASDVILKRETTLRLYQWKKMWPNKSA